MPHPSDDLMAPAMSVSVPHGTLLIHCLFHQILLSLTGSHVCCVSTFIHNNDSNRQQNTTIASKSKEDSLKINNIDLCISIVGLASSAVLFTDSLYVYEFGRIFGFSFWCMSIVLAIRVAVALSLQQQVHDSVMKTKPNKTKSRISSDVIGKVSVPSKTFFLQTSIFICLFTTVVVFLQSGGHVGNVHSTSVLLG